MKKTLTLLITAACFATIGAHAALPVKKNGGLYLSADFGYSHTKFKFNKPGSFGLSTSSKNRDKLPSFDTILSVGWLQAMKNFSYGAEAGLGYAGGTRDNRHIDGNRIYNNKISRGITGDVVGKIGMRFGRGLAYAIGGMAWSQFKFVASGNFMATTNTLKKTASGPTFGAGYQHNLSRKFALRAEYRHTAFKKIKAGKLGYDDSLTTKPKTDAYTMGLVWNM